METAFTIGVILNNAAFLYFPIQYILHLSFLKNSTFLKEDAHFKVKMCIFPKSTVCFKRI